MSSPIPVPTSPSERIPLLDALRGFALCGILVINIKGFSGFSYLNSLGDAEVILGPGAATMEFLTKLLAEGKFYSIFSFLFGLGFSIQLARADGTPGWLRRYARRLRVLFIMGLMHAFLLWSGDILWVYALLGFALLPFRSLRPNTILACALALLLAPVPFYAVCYLVAPGFNTDDLIPNALTLRSVVELYATGSYPVALGVTFEDMLFRFKGLFFSGRYFKVLGMFLLGVWAGRMRILHQPERHKKLLQRVLLAGLVLGLAGSLLYARSPESFRLTPEGIYRSLVYAFGVHPLALAYVAAFVLFWQRAAGQRILSRFGPMGRMALTNYLMQTLLALTIYYGYGLGWYGRMPILATMLAVVPSILLAQLVASAWWLRHFRYGPAEWIWRQATYRRRLSLRITEASKT